MIKALRILLLSFTLVFNLLLALFLFGIGVMGWATGEEVRFDLIPGVKGPGVVTALVLGGLFGLIAVALAVALRKRLPILMVGWNLLVVGLIVCAFTRSSYRFEGEEHFYNLSMFLGMSLLALWGSWLFWRRPRAAKT